MAEAAAVGIEDHGIRFHPLNIERREQLNQWMRDKVLSQAIKYCRISGITGDERRDFLAGANYTTIGLTIGTPRGLAELQTESGMTQFLRVSSDGQFDPKRFRAALEKDGSVKAGDDGDSAFEDAIEDLVDRLMMMQLLPNAGATADGADDAEGENGANPTQKTDT